MIKVLNEEELNSFSSLNLLGMVVLLLSPEVDFPSKNFNLEHGSLIERSSIPLIPCLDKPKCTNLIE